MTVWRYANSISLNNVMNNRRKNKDYFDKTSLGPPPRWLKCPRHGKVIDGKFIPLKTPLSNAYDSQIPEIYRFYVSMIFGVYRNQEKKIGLWIDLTNTDRFYKPEDVENCGAKYYKLHCRGHGECPSDEQTRLFIHVCNVFLKENPNSLIAVHCTHGFNRTGFLIASYLITQKSWSAEAATQAIASARPPGIYKEDYLKELFERYDNVGDTPMAPALPDWCDESSIELDDNECQAASSSASSKQSGPCIEGVPQAKRVTDLSKSRQVQKLMHHYCSWTRGGFPGSQPVSMEIDNIYLLEQKHYEVTWKADGVRYMMLIVDENQVYMFDRDNNVFQVPNLRFPRRKDLNSHVKNTLLDGELIFDDHEGVKACRYLIYDIVWFDANEIRGCDFPRRKLCIDMEIVKPRQRAMAEGLINKVQEPFSVRAKEFWDITQVENVLSNKFQSTVAHEIDGLVFQPLPDPYVPGRCSSVLKWKPSHLNSIDFKLKIVVEKKEGMLPERIGYLYVLHLTEPFDRMKVTKDLMQYDRKIIECSFDNGIWKFMRERKDKSYPNAYETAMGVMKSIKYPITKELLIDFVNKRAKKPRQKLPAPPGSQKRPEPNSNGHAHEDNNVTTDMPPPSSVEPDTNKKIKLSQN